MNGTYLSLELPSSRRRPTIVRNISDARHAGAGRHPVLCVGDAQRKKISYFLRAKPQSKKTILSFVALDSGLRRSDDIVQKFKSFPIKHYWDSYDNSPSAELSYIIPDSSGRRPGSRMLNTLGFPWIPASLTWMYVVERFRSQADTPE